MYEEYKDEKGIHTEYIYMYGFSEDALRLCDLQCSWADMEFIMWGEGDQYDGAVSDAEVRYSVPCEYSRISDSFGSRVHPVTKEVRVHEGIDYAAEKGAEIKAAARGLVYEKGYSDEYGNYVVLLHGNGDMTYYCCCQEITVSQNDEVEQGDTIATVGSSGRSTGAHLHFALSRDGVFVNPAEYMDSDGFVLYTSPCRVLTLEEAPVVFGIGIIMTA